MTFNPATYVSKTECVTAVRIDESNIEGLGKLIHAKYWAGQEDREFYAKSSPSVRKLLKSRIEFDGKVALIGDWVALGKSSDEIKFYSDEQFLGKYHSLSEALSESDRLESVYKIVIEAMLSAREGSVLGLEETAMIASQSLLNL